jgi:sarcosine oxidase
MSDFDVIVVGLGAMGSAALYHLASRGQHVLGLEAFAPGHQLGSWHGESRIIRLAYYEHPDYVPLLQRAYELWERLEREAGVSLLTLSGGLMIGAPDSSVVKGALASAQRHGLEHAMLSAADVHEGYPALQLAEGEVALWEPRAGYLRPERCVEAHLRLATAAGAEVRYETPVRAWQASDAEVQLQVSGQTGAATLTSRQVVFACGARMSSVLGDAIPRIQAERIPVFWLQPHQSELFAAGRLPIYLWELGPGAHVYGFPHVEWPGVKVARHHSGDRCDPDAVDRTITAEDERRLRSAIAERLPGLNGPIVSSTVCLYENSPDDHFLIDRLADQPNVIYAGGFSGHGFKFSSVVGEILADLVTHGEATPAAGFLRSARLAPGASSGCH